MPKYLWGLIPVVFLFLLLDFLNFSQRLFPERISNYNREKVDCYVVLTGGVRRIQRAMEHFKNSSGKCLYISGVGKEVSLRELILANDVKGVSAMSDKIFLDKNSGSTLENAREVTKFLKNNSYSTILLITSNYHIKRAYTLLRKELDQEIKFPVKIYFESVANPLVSEMNWWKNSSGLKVIFGEYFKAFSLSRDAIYKEI